MKTLHVEFPPSDTPAPTKRIEELCHFPCGAMDLTASIPSKTAPGAHLDTLQATATKLIHPNDDWYGTNAIYYASLQDRSEVTLTFALSEASASDLELEAHNYAIHLRDLQGSLVPLYYGNFRGQCEHGRQISCTVLEYCGERLRNVFTDLSLEERHRILGKLGQLHLRKCDLKEFSEYNVLKSKEGKYRLIDFVTLDTNHKDCEFTGDWMFDKHDPSLVGCPILRDIGIQMDAWKSSGETIVTICGQEHNAAKYPPQNIIDALTEPYMKEFWNEPFLLQWFEGIRDYMNTLGIPHSSQTDEEEVVEITEDIRAFAERTRPRMPETFEEWTTMGAPTPCS
ncbi:hypothetical protein Hypma_005119 [Hypsizygus marmoreus]|uniref:Protein kinase domain-containing protein n=1 Tax=Hypsizygus marmoreus TaxID=39966 RepID=A0A369K5D2_HYPMA|nr:hypothetical protein Hypma_005119 [Hypsizygus marmoreus]